MLSAKVTVQSELLTESLLDLLKAKFPAVGMVSYPLALSSYQQQFKYYESWIQDKHHAGMSYLERGLDRRKNPALVFPDLQSVVAVLVPYEKLTKKNSEKAASEKEISDAPQIKYARYLHGRDYHDTVKIDLESVLKKFAQTNHDFLFKVCVDTSAVLERTWAQLCGLGWIGKNTLLIHPKLGSYTFIGIAFTNLKIELPPVLLKDYCGSCQLCLNACPTSALTNKQLDSKRCISYLTLEHRGAWDDTLPLAGYVAGCDICQEVCPFNLKPVRQAESESNLLPEDRNHLNTDLNYLLHETEDEYRERVRNTALSRVKFADFKRNISQFLDHKE